MSNVSKSVQRVVSTPSMRLMELVNKYPDMNWDWVGLSMNPNITYDDIKTNPDKPWNRPGFTYNPNIVIKSPKLTIWKLIKSLFTRKPDPIEFIQPITYEYNTFQYKYDKAINVACHMETYPDKTAFDWYNISKHSGTIFANVKAYPNKPWDWVGISQNPNITIEDVKSMPDKPWNWTFLSRNETMTPEIVEANPDIPWSWYSLSQNPSLSIKLVKNNLDKTWNWFYVSKNPGITLRDIKENLNIPWDWEGVSMNINITFNDVQSNPDLPWDREHIGYNPNITPGIVDANSDLPWNWHALSRNRGKYDPELQLDRMRKLVRMRIRNRALTKVLGFNFWKLYYLSRTREFCEWYYDPENGGGKIAKKRILGVLSAP